MLAKALRSLTTTGFRRGMGGSRAWMATALVAVGIRTIRRMAREEPEVLFRTRVQPGDRFVVQTRPPK